MKNKILIGICLFLATIYTINAQVKIGDNPNTINPNSLIELESLTKGFLTPRMALNDASLPAPLTAPVPVGMLVYSVGGTLSDGFYNWNGSKWVKLANSTDIRNTVTKTADATLLKSDAIVLASNDITLTLPTVTSADDGLTITVKNVGTYTDLIMVVPQAGKKIDVNTSSMLTRWKGETYIASNGNWLLKEKSSCIDNFLSVCETGSFTTIEQVIAFLNEHISGPTVVRLGAETYDIDATQTVNFPYPVTFEGLSYGETYIDGTAGISGSPMFICQTECYFKMLSFNAYSNASGNDAIRFTGSGIYHEVKDCNFEGFNKGIVTTNNTDLWIFENDFNNCTGSGIEIAAGAAVGGRLRVSECDFIQCAKGIHLLSGVSEAVSIINGTFYNTTSGSDIGILYVPATFTSFASMFITNTAWNNQGTYISGFDFSRSDGRDANAFIVNNAGMENENPHCKINVNNNSSSTTITSNGTYYKANWTTTSSYTCKWTLNNNKITYQTNYGGDVYATITGNISVNHDSRIITIAIVKNGVTTTRYGETDLRLETANKPYQFATVIYIPNITKNDYLELYVTSNNSADNVTFQDVQWLTSTQ